MISIDDKPKEQVYDERNQAVLLAAKLAERHDGYDNVEIGYRVPEDENGEPAEDWPVVFIDHEHLGQMGWHIPRDALPEWLEEKDIPYDGHSTDEKHERMQRWIDGLNEKMVNWPAIGGTWIGATTVGTMTAGVTGFSFGLLFGPFIGLGLGAGYSLLRTRARYRGMDPLPTRVIDTLRKEVE